MGRFWLLWRSPVDHARFERIGPPRIALADQRGRSRSRAGGASASAWPDSALRDVPALAGPRIDVDAHLVAGRRIDEQLVRGPEARLDRRRPARRRPARPARTSGRLPPSGTAAARGRPRRRCPTPMTVSHSPPNPALPPAIVAARPARASSVPMTLRTMRVVVLSIEASTYSPVGGVAPASGSIDDGRAVRHDLRHRPGQLGAVEAHRDHRVPAHQRGVLDEPVERLAAGVLEERRVLLDLAAAERAEPGDEVAREPAAADDEPEAPGPSSR